MLTMIMQSVKLNMNDVNGYIKLCDLHGKRGEKP